MKTRKPLCYALAAACTLALAAPVRGDDAAGGATARNPEIKPCPTPGKGTTCSTCEQQNNGGSSADNGCVMVRIGLGDPPPSSPGIAAGLRVFANDPAPELYTPAGLRLVTGFSVMYTTGGRTAAGVPRSVVVVRPTGLAVTFTFADGETVAAAPDGAGGSFPYRLVMADARGWATASDPAYYDLYPGDGSSYRFVAAKSSPDYLQFVRHVSPQGQVSGLRELGVEALRDADGVLAQVRTCARLADIRVLGAASYEVRLYPNTPSAVSSSLGPDGRYAVLDEGSLIESLRFSDPGGAMLALDVARTAGGATEVNSYTYTQATRDWTLAAPGGRVKEKRTTQLAPLDGSHFLLDVLVRDGAGSACTADRYEYVRKPWGNALVRKLGGGAEGGPWTSYEYYGDAPLAGCLKREANSDGSWTEYAYDALGRVTSESKPFADGTAVRETLSGYAPLDPGEAGIPAASDSRPRTVIERVGGAEVARTYHAYPTNALGGWVAIEERAAFPGAPYGHASNPRTVRTYHAPSAETRLAGRLASFAHPGGRIDTYDYNWGTFNEATGEFSAGADGDAWARTVTTAWPGGQTASESVTEVWDRRAMKVLEYRSVTPPGGEPGVISSTRNYYDGAGHLVRAEHSDGRVETAAWGGNCCGKESETSAEGIITVYGYNALKQKVSETRKGFAADGADDLVTLYAYDLDSRVLSVAVTNAASGLGYAASRSAYDALGRVTNAVDRLGNATVTAYSTNGTVTVTRPNGVVAVTERYPDGRTRRALENGIVKQSYAYGVVSPEGLRWTLSARGALPDVAPLATVADLRALVGGLDFPWSFSVSDSLGRTVFQGKPGFGGSALVTSNAYDIAGNLLCSARYAIGGGSANPAILSENLYAYAADGSLSLSALDLNTNGVIDLEGPDRITGSATVYEKDSSNLWWRVSRSWAYPEFNSSAAVTTSVRRVQLAGLGAAQSDGDVLASHSEALDVRGNATVSEVLVDRTARRVMQVTTLPTSVQPAIQIMVNGLLQTTVSSTAITNTFGYDALARQVATTDGRGNTTVTAYNPQGLVAYTEDAATNRTTSAYDTLGRRTEVTDALGNVTHTRYDADSRVAATWGATYPVSYGYDTLGNIVEMGSYRGTTEITDYDNFLSVASGFDKTRWFYENPTGLLTNKLYADGKGPSYTYTPDGKLASRLWARGVLTSYSYDRVGSLVGIDYSDNTPDIVYTYDRLGNRISAVNSVSTNLFVYSSQTMDLVSEAQNGALITRSVDAVGRSVGLEMGNNYAVTYGYDNFGRFSSVSSSICSVSSVASYAWFLGSDVVSGYSDGPLTVTRTFEPNRDRIAQIRNETSPGGIVSQYDYINDVMGRRVSRYDSGFAFDQSHPNIFSYNQRSEVIGVVMNTNIYGYVYDCTGTRLFSFANGKTNIYAANSLNQYTNIIHCSSSITHFSYDTDGNMLTNGVWSYTWDGENRLTFMASNSILVVSNLYDPMSRRFAKSSSGETRIFFYDGWSVICESVDRQGQKTNTNYYVWGLDLDGTMQGSGGIGGLLESSRCISTNSQQSIADSFFCCYDANGNITEYTDEKGVICGHIEYDAFGNKAMMCENILNVFPFKFSTKIFDDENALYYYGYRYYSPEEGSFISRDPLSQVYERAIYRFVNNNTFNLVDLYGLISDEACQKSADNFMNNPGAYSAILRQVLEEIGKIKGCNPLKPKCKCCTGDSSDSWGEVSGDGKILTICSNNMETRDGSTATQRMLETLAHENIHVLQNCRKQDKQSCAGAACAEIQAWLHDGTCHRIAPGAVRKCVIDGAASSAKNRCNNNLDEARRQVEALYEKCNLPVGQGPNF